MRQIEDNPVKEKSRALAVIQDDEGFNWNDFISDEDQIGSAFMAEVTPLTFNRERERERNCTFINEQNLSSLQRSRSSKR
ncbi:hypothetical protein Hanom_Chr15g01402511 [Helianthus anomalus]